MPCKKQGLGDSLKDRVKHNYSFKVTIFTFQHFVGQKQCVWTNRAPSCNSNIKISYLGKKTFSKRDAFDHDAMGSMTRYPWKPTFWKKICCNPRPWTHGNNNNISFDDLCKVEKISLEGHFIFLKKHMEKVVTNEAN